jgi:N-formylglutamate amidohydrolase
MDIDLASLARPTATDPSPFEIRPGRLATPVVFASPHSGRLYPADLMAATRLDERTIRLSEDCFVDALVGAGPDRGASLICATYGRAYMDVNRAPFELDPEMFADALPVEALPVDAKDGLAGVSSARVAAGLGSIARIVAEGLEIYDRKLTAAEALQRIDQIHRPYHAALSELMAQTQRAHGRVVLVDWHSMPSAASGVASGAVAGRKGCDFVLGDRYGSACSGALTRLVDETLTRMGYHVARNSPYAGGYTTALYGRPARGVHALQIEINRGLYLDEEGLTPTAGFVSLKRDLDRLIATLCAASWPDLLG